MVGEKKYANGAIYQGNLIDGRPEGEGTIIFPDGSRYEGSWRGGAYNGWGKYFFASGAVFEGMWAKSTMEGEGKLTVNTEESYRGTWRCGKKQGSFVHMFGGLPYDEEYENDKKVVCPVSYEISTELSSLTGKTIRCWHSDQSGFMIETPSSVLVFDWYRRKLPPIPKNKPLHIFISHVHTDHCNRGMFDLAERLPNTCVYLGCDYSEDYVDEIIDQYSDTAEISCFYGNQHLYTDFGEVKSLSSTDLGVAFLIAVDEMVLYHAGDLALWGSGLGLAEKQFKDCIEPLRGVHIDYAMLPMDPRIGNNGERTVEYYLNLADVNYFTPMHLWENYDYIGTFAKRHPSYCEKMIAVNTQNIQLRHSIERGIPYTIEF